MQFKIPLFNTTAKTLAKFIAVIVAAFVIPQCIYFVLKIAWSIFVIFIIFLMVDIAMIIVIKTWLPEQVDFVKALEWLLYTCIGICSTLLKGIRYLIYHVFNFVTETFFKNPKERSTSRRRRGDYRNYDTTEMRRSRDRHISPSMAAMAKRAKCFNNNNQSSDIKYGTL